MGRGDPDPDQKIQNLPFPERGGSKILPEGEVFAHPAEGQEDTSMTHQKICQFFKKPHAENTSQVSDQDKDKCLTGREEDLPISKNPPGS